MSWILVLALHTNTDGNYVRVFANEQQCVTALKTFVSDNKDNADVKYIGCVPNSLALND